MVEDLLEQFGSDPVLIESALRKGLTARAPASFPYLKLLVEKLTGAAEQTINLPTVKRIEHERIAE